MEYMSMVSSGFSLEEVLLAANEEGAKKKKKKNTEDSDSSASSDTADLQGASTVTSSGTLKLQSASSDEETAKEASTEESTQASEDAPVFFGVDFSQPSWDGFLMLFFLIASLLYGISLGRNRIVVILVSMYMAMAVVNAMPDAIMEWALGQELTLQFTTFIGLFLVLFFMLSRSALVATLGAGEEYGGITQTVVFSILHVGLLITIAMSFMSPETLGNFSPDTVELFTGEWQVFGWIVAPIVAMLFFGRTSSE